MVKWHTFLVHWLLKELYNACHIHPFTQKHSHSDGTSCHARYWPAHQEQYSRFHPKNLMLFLCSAIPAHSHSQCVKHSSLVSGLTLYILMPEVLIQHHFLNLALVQLYKEQWLFGLLDGPFAGFSCSGTRFCVPSVTKSQEWFVFQLCYVSKFMYVLWVVIVTPCIIFFLNLTK